MNLLKSSFFKNWRSFISLPAILWQIIFLFVPFFLLFISSFLDYRDGSFYGFTVQNYFYVINSTHFLVIFRSVVLALLNASICLIIGYPVAYFLSFRVTKHKNFALFLLTLPFWINFLVQVYSWFFILERNGILNTFLIKIGLISEPLHILNTLAGILIVMFHGYLPFMIMPIYNVLEKLDKKLVEASLDLGASHFYTIFKIILPLSFSGLMAGFLLVFVLSFGEFAIPSLLGGDKYLFVGTLISYYFLSIRNFAQGAAFTFLSSFMLVLAILGSSLGLKFLIGGVASDD